MRSLFLRLLALFPSLSDAEVHNIEKKEQTKRKQDVAE
jgi:hypothetical protein